MLSLPLSRRAGKKASWGDSCLGYCCRRASWSLGLVSFFTFITCLLWFYLKPVTTWALLNVTNSKLVLIGTLGPWILVWGPPGSFYFPQGLKDGARFAWCSSCLRSSFETSYCWNTVRLCSIIDRDGFCENVVGISQIQFLKKFFKNMWDSGSHIFLCSLLFLCRECVLSKGWSNLKHGVTSMKSIFYFSSCEAHRTLE